MPKFKIKKKTRMVISGIAIAIASIYAITISYDVSSEENLSFFTGTVALILAVMVMAIGTVVILKLAVRLIRKLAGKH